MSWSQVGRGSVVASKTHPAWYANAVVNNPTATATGAAAATGAGAQHPHFDKKRSKKKEAAVDAASGAAVGAGAGLAVDRGTFYALKSEYKKPEYSRGQNGRSVRRKIKAVKAEAAEKHPNSPRLQEHYKNANWPDGLADTKLRHLSAKGTGGKNAAILAGTGAAIGIGAALARNKKEKVEKMDSVSAFGVEHGYDISKAKDKKKSKPNSPTAGRYVTAAAFPGWHGAFAGKKGSKLKATGSQVGLGLVGGIAGGAVAGNAGAQLGTRAGAVGAMKIGHDKGWYKKQPKGAF